MLKSKQEKATDPRTEPAVGSILNTNSTAGTRLVRRNVFIMTEVGLKQGIQKVSGKDLVFIVWTSSSTKFRTNDWDLNFWRDTTWMEHWSNKKQNNYAWCQCDSKCKEMVEKPKLQGE